MAEPRRAVKAGAGPFSGLVTYVRALGPTGLALGIQFVTFAVTARGLGVAGFGVYAEVSALAAILIEVLGLGTTDVLVRAVARDPDRFADHFGALLAGLAISFPPVLALGLVILLWTAPAGPGLAVLMVGLAGEMIAGRASASAESVLVAHGEIAGAGLVRMIAAGTRLGAAIGFFAVSRALSLWVWVVLAQAVVLALGLGVHVALRYGRPRAGWSWQILRAGQAFALNQTARAVQGNIDRLILAAFADPVALGAYAAGARLLVVGLFPIQVLTRMLYPEFFRRGVDGIAATRRYALAQAPVMLATGYAALAAVVIVAQALPQVLGHDFAGSRDAAMVLACALPLIGLQYLAADTLTGAGHQGVRAVLAVVASAGSGAIMLAGVHLLGGIAGVVAGFIAGQALFLVVLVAACRLVGRREKGPIGACRRRRGGRAVAQPPANQAGSPRSSGFSTAQT